MQLFDPRDLRIQEPTQPTQFSRLFLRVPLISKLMVLLKYFLKCPVIY